MQTLLENWSRLMIAYKNYLTENSGKTDTRAKVSDFLKKLQNYEFLCKVATYLDVLESLQKISLIFESENIMPNELVTVIEQALTLLEYLQTDKDYIDSHMPTFRLEKEGAIIGVFLTKNDGLRKLENQTNNEVVISNMTGSMETLRNDYYTSRDFRTVQEQIF